MPNGLLARLHNFSPYIKREQNLIFVGIYYKLFTDRILALVTGHCLYYNMRKKECRTTGVQ